jgi:hypothetical protein
MQFVVEQFDPGPCGKPSIASHVAGGRSKHSPVAKQHASSCAQAGAALHTIAPMANTITSRDFISDPLPKMFRSCSNTQDQDGPIRASSLLTANGADLP